MFKYLLLDKENYCYGFSILHSIVEQNDMILIGLEENEYSYLNRKYDRNNKVWLDEYKKEVIKEQQLSQYDMQEQILLNTEYLVAVQELNTI